MLRPLVRLAVYHTIRGLITEDGTTAGDGITGVGTADFPLVWDGTMAGDGITAGAGTMAGAGTTAGAGIMAGDGTTAGDGIMDTGMDIKMVIGMDITMAGMGLMAGMVFIPDRGLFILPVVAGMMAGVGEKMDPMPMVEVVLRILQHRAMQIYPERA